MRWLGFGLVLVLVACERPAAPAEASGIVTVQWKGTTEGGFSAPAEGAWCPVDSLLEVLAVRGDTGFALSLLAPDSIRPISYPVVSSTVVVDWRPLAHAAFRWAADTVLKGFEATGGSVIITRLQSDTASGTLDLRMKLNGGSDTIRVAGEFTGVPIRLAAGLCGRFTKPKAR